MKQTFKKWVFNIQAAGYNGSHTIHGIGTEH